MEPVKCRTSKAETSQHDDKQQSDDILTNDNSTVIDWKAALKQSANKTDLARDMLQMLIDYIPEVREVVESSLSQENYDTEALLRHVHKLHGSSAYCGVPRLKQICSTIEKGLNSGSSILDLEPELFELQDEMEESN